VDTFEERLSALKASGAIGGYTAPRANYGLAGGRTPWVISSAMSDHSTTYYTAASLHQAITVLEHMGPMALHNRVTDADRRF
jgi:hypothetical protein